MGNANRILHDSAENGKAKINLKLTTTHNFYTSKLEHMNEMANNPAYAEEAKRKLELKAKFEEEVRDKAKKETDMKSRKSTAALTAKQQPGLQRQRTMKREKSMSLSPSAT